MAFLREAYSRLGDLGAQVVAISADTLVSHQKFVEKLGGLPFPLLSDTERRVIEAYGVLNDKGTGPRRSLFVVDRGGIVRHANRKYELSKPGQAEAVFRVLETLPS
jgi:thioredoxin-dependent peroxiredoxin